MLGAKSILQARTLSFSTKYLSSRLQMSNRLVNNNRALIEWFHFHNIVTCKGDIVCFQHSLISWIEMCTNTNIVILYNLPPCYTL